MNTMNNTNITIHIEHVILDGLPVAAHQRGKLQAAFEAELTQLIMNGELAFDLQTGGIRKQLPAGVLALNADEPVETLGKNLAQAVYRGIGQ